MEGELTVAKTVISPIVGTCRDAIVIVPAGILRVAVHLIVRHQAAIGVAFYGDQHGVNAGTAVGVRHGHSVRFGGGGCKNPLCGGGTAVAPLVCGTARGGEGEGLAGTGDNIGAR